LRYSAHHVRTLGPVEIERCLMTRLGLRHCARPGGVIWKKRSCTPDVDVRGCVEIEDATPKLVRDNPRLRGRERPARHSSLARLGTTTVQGTGRSCTKAAPGSARLAMRMRRQFDDAVALVQSRSRPWDSVRGSRGRNSAPLLEALSPTAIPPLFDRDPYQDQQRPESRFDVGKGGACSAAGAREPSEASNSGGEQTSMGGQTAGRTP